MLVKLEPFRAFRLGKWQVFAKLGTQQPTWAQVAAVGNTVPQQLSSSTTGAHRTRTSPAVQSVTDVGAQCQLEQQRQPARCSVHASSTNNASTAVQPTLQERRQAVQFAWAELRQATLLMNAPQQSGPAVTDAADAYVAAEQALAAAELPSTQQPATSTAEVAEQLEKPRPPRQQHPQLRPQHIAAAQQPRPQQLQRQLQQHPRLPQHHWQICSKHGFVSCMWVTVQQLFTEARQRGLKRIVAACY